MMKTRTMIERLKNAELQQCTTIRSIHTGHTGFKECKPGCILPSKFKVQLWSTAVFLGAF